MQRILVLPTPDEMDFEILDERLERERPRSTSCSQPAFAQRRRTWLSLVSAPLLKAPNDLREVLERRFLLVQVTP